MMALLIGSSKALAFPIAESIINNTQKDEHDRAMLIHINALSTIYIIMCIYKHIYKQVYKHIYKQE